MKRLSTVLFLLLLLLLAGAVGCDEDEERTESTATAEPFTHHECAACGMIVRDQPAPRGQLVHADGERVYFCALSDLVTYAGAPSPHGDIVDVFVEVMPPDTDPSELSTEQLTWHRADDASFVIGEFQRPVMGRPVLSFSTEAEGQSAAARLDGEALSFSELRQTLSAAHEP